MVVSRSICGNTFCFVPLGHADVPNLGIARPGSVAYSFYRVDWACYDSLSVAMPSAESSPAVR